MGIKRFQNHIPRVVYFVDRRCFPEWEIEKQTIHFHDLTFVVEGQAVYKVDGRQHAVEAGDVIYIPAGCVREAKTVKESPMHSFAFNFVWMDAYHNNPLPFERVNKNFNTNEIFIHIREFNDVWMNKQPGYVMRARGLFQLILHRLLSIYYDQSLDTPYDPRVNKVKAYIMEHFAEEVDIAEIAAMLQLHPFYLGKLFKKNTNYSVKEYINKIRVNHAEMMLHTGGFTVSEVADRCGFNDISYFSKVFKASKGYSPSMAAKL
ncbi:AraC family transcriptional regulator [Paenibacillus sepulcri]|uniref:AraC family transcriptional regulator n=1 Tax=Paenibacillus sepulcri TaxID=359917 RepID=A0ABS7BWN9_9BACL|nr:AraC family transcriptional regulator [Paenibacillus sepulcri]